MTSKNQKNRLRLISVKDSFLYLISALVIIKVIPNLFTLQNHELQTLISDKVLINVCQRQTLAPENLKRKG